MTTDMKPLDVEAALNSFTSVAKKLHWESLQSARNLATAVAVETGELLEQFQWLDENQLPDKDRVSAEIADITLYMIALCDKLGIDFSDAIKQKTAANQARFG